MSGRNNKIVRKYAISNGVEPRAVLREIRNLPAKERGRRIREIARENAKGQTA